MCFAVAILLVLVLDDQRESSKKVVCSQGNRVQQHFLFQFKTQYNDSQTTSTESTIGSIGGERIKEDWVENRVQKRRRLEQNTRENQEKRISHHQQNQPTGTLIKRIQEEKRGEKRKSDTQLHNKKEDEMERITSLGKRHWEGNSISIFASSSDFSPILVSQDSISIQVFLHKTSSLLFFFLSLSFDPEPRETTTSTVKGPKVYRQRIDR